MSATTAESKARLIGVTMLASMTFAWWWSDAQLVQNKSMLLATIIFVASVFVLFVVAIASVRCAQEAYRSATGRWSFHIGWFALMVVLAIIAGTVVWILLGAGPIGLDQLPWLKLPRNIIGEGWRYGVVYVIALTLIMASPRALRSSTRRVASSSGGIDELQRTMMHGG